LSEEEEEEEEEEEKPKMSKGHKVTKVPTRRLMKQGTRTGVQEGHRQSPRE
jgi:hypothetical protein